MDKDITLNDDLLEKGKELAIRNNGNLNVNKIKLYLHVGIVTANTLIEKLREDGYLN